MLDVMTGDASTEALRQLIQADSTLDEYDPQESTDGKMGTGGTSHLAVLGADGSAVSATGTVGSL